MIQDTTASGTESTELPDVVTVILLMTFEVPPVPENVTQLENFGSESVRGADGGVRRGDCIMVRGAPKNIASWLKDVKEIWTSQSPVTGVWKMVQLKEGLVS